MIWLASYPRAGNKLAQQVLHHSFGLKVRTIYDVSDNSDIAPKWDGAESEVFVKTHELTTSDNNRVLYIARDPRDIYCSYARYSMATNNQFRDLSFEAATEKLLLEMPYGGWSNHFESWSNRFDRTFSHRMQIIRYEDLVDSPVGVMRTVCEVFGKQVTLKGELPIWEELQAGCGWFFQKGVAGRWREEMSTRLVTKCKHLHGRTMQRLGYL